MTRPLPAGLCLHLAEGVRAARRRYRTRLARCQKKFSENAVHELRIQTRRILALLDLLQTLGFPAPVSGLSKKFKKRLELFGELRDTQVQLRLLKSRWSDFPEAQSLRLFLERTETRLVSRLARKIQALESTR